MAQGICNVSLVKPTGGDGIYVMPLNYGLSLSCMQQLETNSGMQIIFPADFMLKEGACTVNQQSANYSCNIDATSRIITI